MKKKTKLITDLDLARLSSILAERLRDREAARLDDLLASLEVVERDKAPPDLVTMNSMVRGALSPEEGDAADVRSFTLVYPRAANATENRVSVLTPFGMELLGSRVGDWVAWRGHDGAVRKMRLEEVVYQPEASGDWNL